MFTSLRTNSMRGLLDHAIRFVSRLSKQAFVEGNGKRHLCKKNLQNP